MQNLVLGANPDQSGETADIPGSWHKSSIDSSFSRSSRREGHHTSSIQEKEGKGDCEMRLSEGSRRDQIVAAGIHRVDAGEPNTAR